MLGQISRYYHTLRYLQWIQIRYRLLYQWRKVVAKPLVKADDQLPDLHPQLLDLIPGPESPISWRGKDTFCFLHLEHYFKQGIDWNFPGHGKLWTYNLNYFEFLLQPGLSKYEGLGLIHDFISKLVHSRDGMEPFPISLRVQYWIKFLSKHQIRNQGIDQSLYLQVCFLKDNLEYHLLGNHLLENGFALLFAAVYFQETDFLEKADQILVPQLAEQILSDGAHFELSPMYHQLMLYRILDAINILTHHPIGSSQGLLVRLGEKAGQMLGWMMQMTLSNGDMALLNDSAPGIAPDQEVLLSYATRLGLKAQVQSLGESGYRRFENEVYEILIDLGAIGPDYIPGHAHSDTFNFVLYHRGTPLIVDVGISTYEKNERRQFERSTASHNTVMLNGQEQSEVWGGFRVARRANVLDLKELDRGWQASHDGYARVGAKHQRRFIFEEEGLTIEDETTGAKLAQAFFHFHPNIAIEQIDNTLVGSFGRMTFDANAQIILSPYEMALGYNQRQRAIQATITFKENLHTKIQLS
ncbi:MAG: alginate lyase family protein [Bacteroidota bacterium]